MKKAHFFVGIGLLIGTILIFAYPYFVAVPQSERPASDEAAVLDSVYVAPIYEPEIIYGFVVDSMVVIEDRIKRNQNLSTILSKHNVDHQKIYNLDRASKKVFDVRRILPNRKVTLICYPDTLRTLKALIYEPSDTEYVVYNLADSVSVQHFQKSVEIREVQASGIITSSLAETMMDLGLSPMLTNDFADIFAWQIDFWHLYPGDRFKLIYEEQFVEDKPVGIGEIISALFTHSGNDYLAVRYDQGNGYDYFDEDGQSLRKALLRYPVKFSRISSRYSGRRLHPVQKTWKAHLGTDFAASRGTPIRSVGDGIVLEARYRNANGNYVKVKHNGNYTTGYLHMSKIKTGVQPGTKVKQGQIIGYVGSTGLARGNHVCFRFWKNGVQVDALKVKLPPSEPITSENLDRYIDHMTQLRYRLEQIPYPDEDQLVARVN